MMLVMRTTITLDPDVAALLHKRMQERGIGLKEAVNAALREALRPAGAKRQPWTKSVPMGVPNFPVEKALQVAAEVEDAHLATLALQHRATVVTFDRDFERFGVPAHDQTA